MNRSNLMRAYAKKLLLVLLGMVTFWSIVGWGEDRNDCGSGSGSGCGGNSPIYPTATKQINNSENSDRRNAEIPQFNANLKGTSSTSGLLMSGSQITPGGSASLELKIDNVSGSAPFKMTYYPPVGAAASFDTLPSPGGPPYIFNNLSASQVIKVNLQFSLPSSAAGTTVSQTLIVEDSTGASAAATLTLAVTGTSGTPFPPLEGARQETPAAGPRVLAPASATIEMWRMNRWFYMDDQSLTTTLCQNLYNWLQSPSTFVALRVPVSSPDASTSYNLPVAFGLSSKPAAYLKNYSTSPSSDLFTTALEYRPTRLDYANNVLAGASGQRWITLGFAGPAVTCPGGLSIPAGKWEFQFTVFIDLNSQLASIPLYYCYEGQNSPPVLRAAADLARLQAAGEGLQSVQSDGITCIGPQDQPLASSLPSTQKPITLNEPHILWNTPPGQEVQFMHYITTNGAQLVNLSASSDMGISWSFYLDSGGAPNKSQPISSPWSVSSTQFFWAVGTIPEGAASGSHTIQVKAASASDPNINGTINNLVYVGTWVTPHPVTPQAPILPTVPSTSRFFPFTR